MKIDHLPERNRFQTTVDEFIAYVEYSIDGQKMNIRHTIVPKEIGGRGIASVLVQATYEYAKAHGLIPYATCSYAISWLQKHPEFT